MLSSAVQRAKNDPLKNNTSKKPFTASNPTHNGDIKESFKKNPSSQSMGGFVGSTNLTKAPLKPVSSNVKPANTKARQPSIPRTGSIMSSTSTAANSSVYPSSVFGGNFQDTPSSTFQDLGFNEDDWSDDDKLDFDVDYPLPTNTSMAAPPKPLRPTIPSSPAGQRTPANIPPSSAPTWSSSPPSHKETPPGARQRRQLEQFGSRQSAIVIEDDEDPNPRPAKRRTLPWIQKKAEQEEASAKLDEELDAHTAESSSALICFKCREKGHSHLDCPTGGKGKPSQWDFTPLPKDKKMPWNTTASAIKEEKKLIRDKRKRKADGAEAEAADSRGRTKTAKFAPIQLTDEQNRVKDLVVNQGKSVFFTGSAGTGKSVLMRAIIAALKKKYVREGDRVAVTASTGLAACNIGGVTLHSFGGIGLGKEDVDTLTKKIKKNSKAKTRWLRTKVLVIDEISMVDGDLFDKLEAIARKMRNIGRAFGGIQLVITGDFFQLPPVPDFNQKGRGVKFAFDAVTWNTSIHHTIGLTEVFRQKDPVFANMLNEMRLGKVSQETIEAFGSMKRAINYEDQLTATELFPTRNEVENSNAFRMRSLHGKSYVYEAVDSGTITDVTMREKLLSNMMAPKTMELKKGAQVMLIKNMDEGLVNGSLGKVVAFMTEKSFEIYDANPDILNDDELSDLSQENQRQEDLQKFKMINKELPNTAQNNGKLYPLVRFSLADGTLRDLLVQPEEWKIELPSGEVQAQRSQLPLILAWALSIHKAQGQTLERVKIDLKKVFENGQAYVALSRATSQAGLEVQNFDPKKVTAHPRVADFYNSLYSVNKALQHPKVAKAEPAKVEPAKKAVKSSWEKDYDFDDDEEEMARLAYG